MGQSVWHHWFIVDDGVKVFKVNDYISIGLIDGSIKWFIGKSPEPFDLSDFYRCNVSYDLLRNLETRMIGKIVEMIVRSNFNKSIADTLVEGVVSV